MTRRNISFIVIFGLSGCGGKDGGGGSYSAEDIEDASVRGTIGGTAWEMVTADVQADPFDDGLVSVSLYADAVEPCGFATSDLPFVLFSIAPVVAEVPLSLSLGGPGQTVTLVVPPSQNNIATEGLVDVRAVSDTEIEIGLVAFMDDDNQVNGTFTAERCPDDGI